MTLDITQELARGDDRVRTHGLPAHLQLVTLTDLLDIFRCSRPTLWRVRRDPAFPTAITITGQRSKRWRAADIEAFLASRQTR